MMLADTSARVEALMTQAVYPGKKQALVDNWNCLRQYVAAYEVHCGVLTTYAARHTRTMANLCNAELPVAAWQAAVLQQCGVPR
jgi:hypothetical protein